MKTNRLLSFACALGTMLLMNADTYAQNAKNSNDPVYTISMTDESGKAASETLTIGREFSTSSKHPGFEMKEYLTKPDADGVIHFSVIMESATQGTKTWRGEIKGNTITGVYLWEKVGQDGFKTTFSGTKN